MRFNRKILFPYRGDMFGGSDISSLILVRALLSEGVDVKVGVHQDGALLEYLRSIGVPWVELPSIGKYPGVARDWRRLIPLRQFLRLHDIGIVHTNDRRMHLAWLIPAKLAGAAHLWHQRTPLTSRMANLQARFATKIICISEYCQASLSSFNRRHAILLANPIEAHATEQKIAEARKHLAGDAQTKTIRVVGFFSNWEARKRPEMFVEIAARIRVELGYSVKFAMFGEPREGLRDRVMCRVESLGLRDSFLFMGQKSPIEPWIAACDLVIAPARSEGFGRVLVESMQLGTFVLASADGGHLEIVQDGHNGFLFPVDDVNQASEKAVIALTDQGKSSRIRKEAKSEALGKYSVKAHFENVLEVYCSV